VTSWEPEPTSGTDPAGIRDQDAGRSRRSILTGLGIGALGTLLPASAVQAAALPVVNRLGSIAAAPLFAQPRTLSADEFKLHLLRRATWGPTVDSMAAIDRRGPKSWLASQLHPKPGKDMLSVQIAELFPDLGLSLAQVRALVFEDQARIRDQFQAVNVARATWSDWQLLEVMTDLWSNHLNVPVFSSDTTYARADYGRVIRESALEPYGSLLPQAVLHPAMLLYLNNDVSDKYHPNENLGRELLELHTVGVEAGYTQKDVVNSARILTGAGVDPVTGAFKYTPENHWVGPVKVLGFTHPNSSARGGMNVIRAYLNYLVQHPATARRVATKLAVRFVADEPPAGLVDTLAQVYLRSSTRIAPVLDALFSSPQFAASAGMKLRTPYEDIVAAMRALGVQPPASPDDWPSLWYACLNAGQVPQDWPTPDGYPHVSTYWSSPGQVLCRFNSQWNLASGNYPKVGYLALEQLLEGPVPSTWQELVRALARRVLFQEPTDDLVSAVVTLSGFRPQAAVRAADTAWCVPNVVLPMLLHSPTHTGR